MFELPDAKRVRRQDLFDADSSRQSSPEEEQAEIQARLKARLSDLFTLPPEFTTQEDGDGTGGGIVGGDEAEPGGEEAEEPEFEFRLFSTGPAQKVVLAPAEDGKDTVYDKNSGGILEPRPLSYYVRGELSSEEKERFQSAAISAGDVLKAAKQRAWGLELPWRVTKITVGSAKQKRERKEASTDRKEATAITSSQAASGKKKKPGKKARIAARTAQKAAAELEKQKLTKEEHLKEKKKRLNREKKLKRRQKEREKKQAGAVGGGGADGAESMSEGED